MASLWSTEIAIQIIKLKRNWICSPSYNWQLWTFPPTSNCFLDFKWQNCLIWIKRHQSYNMLQRRCEENIVEIIKNIFFKSWDKIFSSQLWTFPPTSNGFLDFKWQNCLIWIKRHQSYNMLQWRCEENIFDDFNNIFFTSSWKHIVWLMSLDSYHCPWIFDDHWRYRMEKIEEYAHSYFSTCQIHSSPDVLRYVEVSSCMSTNVSSCTSTNVNFSSNVNFLVFRPKSYRMNLQSRQISGRFNWYITIPKDL